LLTTDASRPEACDAVLTRGSHTVDGGDLQILTTTDNKKSQNARCKIPKPSLPVLSCRCQNKTALAVLGWAVETSRLQAATSC